MSQVDTAVSSKGQGKRHQVTGDSRAQRSSWGNPGITSSGKGGFYFWKHLGKSKS